MGLIIYYTNVTSNKEVRTHQNKVFNLLDPKKVSYDKVDISAPDNAEKKRMMQEKVKEVKGGDKPPLMPQIFYDDDYLGDFEDFDRAVEDGEWETFLRQ